MASASSKLNIRLMIIHFIAFWFFIYGVQTLSFLHDFTFLFTLPQEARTNEAVRFNDDMNLVNQSGFIGLILAYIISWMISLKRNWFWLNSVLIFALAWLLKKFALLGWTTLQVIFLKPGHLFGTNTVGSFLTNGLIMIAIGSVLLFSKGLKRFIENGVKTDKNKFSAKGAKS